MNGKEAGRYLNTLVATSIEIAEEMKGLKEYIALHKKKKEVTEYQVYKTLYLKQKLQVTLGTIDGLTQAEGEESSQGLLLATTKMQLQEVLQHIEALDWVNDASEITSEYTYNQTAYIKKAEKLGNPKGIKEPIPTKLYYVGQTQKAKGYRGGITLIILGIISLVTMLGVGGFGNEVLMAVLGGVGGAFLFLGIMWEMLRGKEEGDTSQEQEEDVYFVIPPLAAKAYQMARDLKVYQRYIHTPSHLSLIHNMIAGHKKSFDSTKDYRDYVELVLIAEEVNPLLIERGIKYREPILRKAKSFFQENNNKLADSNHIGKITRQMRYRVTTKEVVTHEKKNKSYSRGHKVQYTSGKARGQGNRTKGSYGGNNATRARNNTKGHR